VVRILVRGGLHAARALRKYLVGSTYWVHAREFCHRQCSVFRQRAPLDNNLVERALKIAILNRKNALFYKTLKGAQVGDLFMSLIHTCELNGANPFDYLTELQRDAQEVKQKPSEWMPWNYRETLARLALSVAA
jgi:hypothetical protein